MTLNEANNKLEKINNDLEYELNEKQILFNKTQPQAVDTTKENVEGGTREDKNMKYVESLEEKEIDDRIDKLVRRKRNIQNWISKELKILNKYNELEQLIRYYKENERVYDAYKKKNRELTWKEIGTKVSYHPDYCRRIYRLYKRKRDVGE